MATAKSQGGAHAKKGTKAKTTTPKKKTQTTKKVEVNEEKNLTETSVYDKPLTNEAEQPATTKENIIMAKKIDAEGYLLDDAGNRVLTADQQPILIRKPKKYNDLNQELDDAGNVVINKRTGLPKTKPVRTAATTGQRVLAKKLRKAVDSINEIIDAARAQGLNYTMSYSETDSPALDLGEMVITEKL